MAIRRRHSYFSRMDQTATDVNQPSQRPRHPAEWREAGFYKFWTDEQVRYADLDPQGHVNNNSYGIYFETVRIALLSQLYPKFWEMPVTVVLKAIDIEYHAELHYPGKLRLGARLLQIGTTSFTGALSVFVAEKCCATARSTVVAMDKATRQPTAVPEALRHGYRQYL